MVVIRFRAANVLCCYMIFNILYLGKVACEEDGESSIKLTKSEGDDDMPEEREGMIRLSPPKLDDEEQNSPHMPHALRCDGCRAIAHQLSFEFYRRHRVRPKLKRLTESDVMEIVERVCNSHFDNYGLKAVDGVNRLSGPGLETEKSPGMMQGGGRWPVRFQNMCNAYVGELDEEGIYEGYLEDNTLENFLCRREGLFGYCKDTPPTKKEEL
ncbi:marginal zone B- and B1-cell-specific protein-like isoform X1 [Saccostrea cucullata]|uniref:marginal zone B- and B1-cell-specific protein-like isoform X1 n=1 Tax=Saccostrea cuccullata TaxID=36930 RepID=UPI002ED25DAE